MWRERCDQAPIPLVQRLPAHIRNIVGERDRLQAPRECASKWLPGRATRARAITGPLFQYSDTWQLVINTGTTIVTFLMVFLIQNSQNRDSAAIQVKLDELIRVSIAQNSFVGIEHLTDEELEDIRSKCEQRAKSDKDDDQDGEDLVKRTGNKARKAAERAVAAE